jgi:hypothetical protein
MIASLPVAQVLHDRAWFVGAGVDYNGQIACMDDQEPFNKGL